MDVPLSSPPPAAATTAAVTPAAPAAALRTRVSANGAARCVSAARPGSPVDLVIRRHFAGTPEFERTTHAIGPTVHGTHDEEVDVLFLTDKDPHAPADVFDRIRWGGQFVFVSRSRAAVEQMGETLRTWRLKEGERGAWVIEEPLRQEKYRIHLRLLGWRRPAYFLVARKILLVPPGKSSDRFTYNVYLEWNETERRYEVVKEVPTQERVLARLREKFPGVDAETLRRRARKFTDKIFPVFLTRETAILRLLQRDLPAKYRNNVPQVLEAKADSMGYTRQLRMNWLRNAQVPVSGRETEGVHGRPLTQLEFAHQSAELLAALHDHAGVMHLDLRLDNFVITDHGVGFVDFGSAVRVGEAFPEASLLSNLFDEMMRTSQIQRMLGKMTESGMVTREEICNSYHKIDKAVDFFYLAVQINAPHSNPDFRGLVEFEKGSAEAVELAKLTEQILRPTDEDKPRFTSARDILKGIEEVEARLRG
jgi:tRNA A-37 threonylcarbamoyl transferase component Bud32